ncbi:hypothetical protein VC218_07155 [Xanthomonas nasturtii]|uniref:hypothetical protein n=1 Tax=Xanthomonas nasturtii TaxID=1843581 RepID=UPI002B22DD49|nr:hypothetical protein [Xanthomonas nasturtii]MEA9578699.1 hypothetical protein [Xanthomonas nasturtii]
MLIEQAFFSLPEVLHGSGYQSQSYESGIVSALTLALLQVLNGRNVPNPIGCLQSERLYRSDGLYAAEGAPRYLRADLFADVNRLYVANKRLSQYGWRHHLWLECKFLRGQAGLDGNQHAGNKSPATGAILADLLRLALLVPEKKKNTHSSRYFLHVYDADPKFYLTTRDRAWCRGLVKVGEQEIRLSALEKEPKAMRRLIGDLPGLDVKLQVTNFHAGPLHVQHRPIYWCWLTRIDKVEATLGPHTVTIDVDRTIIQSDDGLAEIAAFIAARLAILPESPDTQPPRPDEQEEAQAEDEAIAGIEG